tara:strand:- start:139 stop:630 length:492 start_codon:yes stop_codon:yes gene_type:complete
LGLLLQTNFENNIFVVPNLINTIMKKLLYLLFAIALLGCGSDEDDNASAQTFLEKYDGYIWVEEETTELLQFSNSPKSYMFVDNTYPFCAPININDILENAGDTLIFEHNDGPNTFVMTATAIDGGESVRFKCIFKDENTFAQDGSTYWDIVYNRTSESFECQ